MNTPAHVLASGLLLGRGRLRSHWAALCAGAVLPDLPMVGFYAYQRLLAGRSERWIWSEAYFDPTWQAVFDLFNSLPLIATVGLIAWRLGRYELVALTASMALHGLCDLAVHHEDAHGHFYPFSDWRFRSPVSYWDPRHFGRVFASAEAAFVVIGSGWLVLRGDPRPWRFVGAAVLAGFSAFVVFAVVMWLELD